MGVKEKLPDVTADFLHRAEHAAGWAYATVWRFASKPADAAAVVDFDPFPPPEGSGWQLNLDRAPNMGREVEKPGWSDGSRYMQVTYWRARQRVATDRPGPWFHKQLPDA